MRRLIVNADDFGLTGGINRAILDLYRVGGLTSSTLMAASPQSAEAVALAKQETSLGVGCHVVLLDGFPSAEPASIASLLSANDTSRFRFTLGEFVRDLYLGRIEPAHIEREATAQLLHLQQAGVRVTHIDTHKHTHMFPAVLDAVTRAATACGVRAIRNPFEPAWSMVATPNAGSIRKLQVHLLRRFHKMFLRLVQERNLAIRGPQHLSLDPAKPDATARRQASASADVDFRHADVAQLDRRPLSASPVHPTVQQLALAAGNLRLRADSGWHSAKNMERHSYRTQAGSAGKTAA